MPAEQIVTNGSRTRHAPSATGLAVAVAAVCVGGFAPAAQAQSAAESAPSPRALLRSMTDYLAAQRSIEEGRVVEMGEFDL